MNKVRSETDYAHKSGNLIVLLQLRTPELPAITEEYTGEGLSWATDKIVSTPAISPLFARTGELIIRRKTAAGVDRAIACYAQGEWIRVKEVE